MMLIFSRQDALETRDTCKGVFEDVPSIHVFDKRIGWTTHFYEYNEVQSSVPYSPESQTTMFMETWGKCIPSLHVIRLRIFFKKNHTATSSGDLRHSGSQSPHLLHGHVIARFLETHHQMEHSTVCSVHSHDEVRAKAIRMVIIIRFITSFYSHALLKVRRDFVPDNCILSRRGQ